MKKPTKKAFIAFLKEQGRNGQKEYNTNREKFNSDFVEWAEKLIPNIQPNA
jgi:hypothetical protein